MLSTRLGTRHTGKSCAFAAAGLLQLAALQIATAAHKVKQPAPAPTRIAVLGAAGCIDDAQIELLRSLAPVTVENHRRPSESQTVELLKGATVAIVNPYVVPLTRPVFEGADSLQLVVLPITGFDKVDLDAAGRKHVRVINSPDYSLEAVAEDTIALLLAAVRHVPEADSAVREGQFMTSPPDQKLLGFELSGKTLGVIGLGRIGIRVAEIARVGFGMKTIAWDRKTKSVDGVTQVSLEELLAQSDVVSLHLALSDETTGILTAARLRLMKPTAVLVNTARGELIDEPALYSALQEGRLAAAGLDTITEMAPSNPLLKLHNVVLGPHAAYHSRESQLRCAESVIQAVRTYIESSPKHHGSGD